MNSLKTLLDDLDRVGMDHDEIGDTEVREQMSAVIQRGFVVPAPGYGVPEKLGMFSDEADQAVRKALTRFLISAVPEAKGLGLVTPEQRLRAFENGDIESDEGMFFDDYFGGSE